MCSGLAVPSYTLTIDSDPAAFSLDFSLRQATTYRRQPQTRNTLHVINAFSLRPIREPEISFTASPTICYDFQLLAALFASLSRRILCPGEHLDIEAITLL